jgi:two-component system NtrC family response regulator
LKIAIVEDDINVRKSLEIAMGDYPQFEVISFKSATDTLKKIDSSFDLIITDLNMPRVDGIDFIKELKGQFDVIVITGNATLQRAVESLKLGVKDFLIKPFEIDKLIEAIERVANEKERPEKVKNSKTSKKRGKFIGTSPALERVLDFANRSAKTDVTVMLLGESGVGKELFARYIHENSKRANRPFIAINMASIPETLLESELFGYEKGAFTDATSSKEGQFELANGGTIFLDEIADMPYPLQAKILRVIQEREIRRLGSKKLMSIDVRIVSATNLDIEKAVLNGKFRKDLYYRLNTVPIHIPPLRERRDEILEIAEKSLDDFCKKYQFENKSFSESAKNRLLNYSWHGNIRELISVVERGAVLSDGKFIEERDLLLN